MGTIEQAGSPAGHFSERPGHPSGDVGDHDDGTCRLTASGEFAGDGNDQVRQVLAETVAAGWRRIEVDFGAVTSIDSGAVRMLADCRYHAARHGCELIVVNLGPRLRRPVHTIHGITQLNGDSKPPWRR